MITTDDLHSCARMLEVRDLHKTVAVGFRRRKVEILQRRRPRGARRRRVRPARPERRRQDHHAEGRARPDAAVRRERAARRARSRRARLPAREPLLLRLPERPRVAALLRPPVRRSTSDERDRRVAAILADVGLERAAGMQLRKYSKGMLQRIGIAQALINEPTLRAPRRAHDRARPGRQGRGEAHHPAPRTSGARRCSSTRTSWPTSPSPVHAHRHHARRPGHLAGRRRRRRCRRAQRATSRSFFMEVVRRDARRWPSPSTRSGRRSATASSGSSSSSPWR